MKDQFGNEMTVYVVSGRSEPQSSPTTKWREVHLTLLLKSRIELKKIDVSHRVYPDDRMVLDEQNKNESKFGPKWAEMEKAMLKLVDEDRSVGKFFLREAMEAYGVKEKLNHGQIEEVMMGVFLVGGVSRL